MKTTALLKTAATAIMISITLSGATLFASAAKEMHARGTLEKIDNKASAFVLKDVGRGVPLTYHWGKDTKFSKDGKAATVADLKPGERLNIRYEASGKQNLVREVMVLPESGTATHPTAAPANHSAPKPAQ